MDRYYCEKDGFHVPIGHELYRDKAVTKLCRDEKLQDCLLEKKNGVWVAVHRPVLDGACRMVDSDGVVLGNLGQPSEDGKHCRYQAQKSNGGYGQYTASEERLIGQRFYTNDDRTAVCIDEAMRHCFLKPPEGQHTLAWGNGARATTALIEGGADEVRKEGAAVVSAANTAKDLATGKVKMATVWEEGKELAEHGWAGVEDLARSPEKRRELAANVMRRVAALEQSAKKWMRKPPEEQLEDGMRVVGSGTIMVGSGEMLGGATRLVGEGVATGTEVLTETANAGKKVGHGVQTAEHVEHKVAGAARVENKAAHAASVAGNDEARLTAEEALEKRIAKKVRSLEKRRDEHLEKLEAYKKNPEAFDNLGYLQNAPSAEVRNQIINARIRHLEHEIANFEKQIAEARRGVE
jgi:hypothetical protein